MAETARTRTRTATHPHGDGNVDKCTCFVRRVPQDVKEDEILELFGAVGPVKKAFIVQEKGEENHKGYAFVTFALAEDAKKAVQKLANHSLKGSRLKVEQAQRRVPLAERHKSGDRDKEDKEGQKHHRGLMSPEQKAEYCKAVAVGGMSSEQIEAVGAKAKSLGTVTGIDVEVPVTVAAVAKLPQDGCPDGAILVRYSSVKEAMEAVWQLHRCKFKSGGKSVTLWARQVKQWRLILRNLPFSVDEGELIKYVGEAAFVWDASIPKDKSGKKKGFGFVSFTCRAHAATAMAHVNSKKLKGRVLVADWSVPKNEFDTDKAAQDGPAVHATASPGAVNSQLVDEESEGSPEDSQESSDEEPPSTAAAVAASESEVEDPEALSDAALHVRPGEKRMYEDVLAGLFSEKSTSDVSAKQPVKGQKRAAADDQSRPDKKQAQDVAAPKDKDAAEPKDKDAAGKQGKKPGWEGERSEAPAGQKEDGSGLIQRQVFVRNLPLDVLPPELSSCMQRFGEVKACRLVMNKSTGKLKGTAFIEFQAVEGATAACKSSSSQKAGKGEGVTLRGKLLTVDAALVQDKARSLAVQLGSKDQSPTATHKRNLHLAREGRIENGTDLWNQLSERDQRKRIHAVKEANLKLKSPNFFISSTRLRLLNVPAAWDEKQLKSCCHKAVLDRATRADPSISQCVILRDNEKTDNKGQAKSRGCAFVEFESHEDALVCLRQMNNNPALFGGKPARPIVEFAVENVRALQIQQKKRSAIEDMKQQRSMAEVAPGEDAASKKKNKKRKRRGDKDTEPGETADDADQPKKRSNKEDSGSIQKSRSKDRREKSTGGAEGQPAATVHKAKAKVEPKASDEQARGAVRKRPNKRPNKRIPANVDDLDKALSKRARQLFSSGISM